VDWRFQIYGSASITFPWDLSIGRNSTIGPDVALYNLGGLEIGSSTVISQNVHVCGGTHDHTKLTYPLIREKIKIGNFVWIAADAFIAPGVTIGDGALVGARAVVVKDVEPYTIVAGNPARVIGHRTLENQG
jgi:putative colanic acid biosynthesis acetyltransferase WcaF